MSNGKQTYIRLLLEMLPSTNHERLIWYLSKRGIENPEEIIHKYQLKYIPPSLKADNIVHLWKLLFGIEPKEGLIYPVIDKTNSRYSFIYRTFSETEDYKYLISPGGLVYDYIPTFLYEHRLLFVTEGLFDMLLMRENIQVNAVAIMGVSNISIVERLFGEFVEIVLALDNDEAGIAAAIKAYTLLKKRKVTPRVGWLIYDSKDPAEAVATGELTKTNIANHILWGNAIEQFIAAKHYDLLVNPISRYGLIRNSQWGY